MGPKPYSNYYGPHMYGQAHLCPGLQVEGLAFPQPDPHQSKSQTVSQRNSRSHRLCAAAEAPVADAAAQGGRSLFVLHRGFVGLYWFAFHEAALSVRLVPGRCASGCSAAQRSAPERPPRGSALGGRCGLAFRGADSPGSPPGSQLCSDVLWENFKLFGFYILGLC